MKTLKNLLRKEKKPLVERVFSADEIKSFFQANGIDMETIGFPSMKYRKSTPFNAYYVNFSNIRVIPVKIDSVVTNVIKGTYRLRAVCSNRDEQGHWYPGIPTKRSFKIKDGKLSLGREKTPTC